jgi:hypothetical protein
MVEPSSLDKNVRQPIPTAHGRRRRTRHRLSNVRDLCTIVNVRRPSVVSSTLVTSRSVHFGPHPPYVSTSDGRATAPRSAASPPEPVQPVTGLLLSSAHSGKPFPGTRSVAVAPLSSSPCIEHSGDQLDDHHARASAASSDGQPHEHLGAGALPVFSPRARSPYACPDHSGEQPGRSHDLLRACRVQTRTTPAIRQPPCHQPASFRRRPVLGNVSLECYDLNVVARRDRSEGWHQNGSRLGTPAQALRGTWYPRTRGADRGGRAGCSPAARR